MKKLLFTTAIMYSILFVSSCQKKPTESQTVEEGKTDTLTTQISKTAESKEDFKKVVTYQTLSFEVTKSGDTLSVQPSGFEIDNSKISKTIEGTVTNVEVEDLNSDGSPELLIYVTSSGSGSYGTAIGYSGNNNKSLSEITIPSIAENPKANKGYMGHDEFTLAENTLIQRFPIYKDSDSNNNPTGGYRQIQYKLKDGESSRKLVIDKIVEN